MKPFKIVLFVCSVFLILFTITLYWPEGDIELTDKLTINFPDYREFFLNRHKPAPNIEDIILQLEDVSTLQDTIIEVPDSDSLAESPTPDTLESKQDKSKLTNSITREVNVDILQNKFYPFNKSSLAAYNYLKGFFSKLDHAKKGSAKIRIMHYGDSQIEGDRLTSKLRYHFHMDYGGGGPGLISLVQPYNFQLSLKQKNSGSWFRYTGYGKTDEKLKHNRYGPLMSFSTFSPLHNQKNTYTAEVNFTSSPYGQKNAFKFEHISLLYSHNSSPFYYELAINDAIYDADFIERSQSFSSKTWKYNSDIDKLSFYFEGKSSPQFYGLSLESEFGVIVDNIGLRGSSGVIFTKGDHEIFKSAIQFLNPDMFILQFGGNAIPYVNKQSLKTFEKWYTDQIKFLQTTFKNTPIIIIGVADMSVRKSGNLVTHPNLQYIKKAIENSVNNTNVLYWDLFEAMGGENSMPAWAYSDPPLASKDFIHFSHVGVKIVADMFYNSLMMIKNSKTENK